jgi:signal transduction histidine kinase
VRNALEAQGAGAGAIEIETRAGGEDNLDLVELRIRDHGPGIPEAILGRVFEPYVTTKARGTGLGLAIVKKIIDEHGGQVWAENHAEGGASVVVRLPPARHRGLALPPGRQRRAG